MSVFFCLVVSEIERVLGRAFGATSNTVFCWILAVFCSAEAAAVRGIRTTLNCDQDRQLSMEKTVR
jgi:hypothetical protein